MIYRDFDETDNEHYLQYCQNCIQMASELTPYSLLALRGEPYHVRRAYSYGLCFHQGVLGDVLYYGCPVGEWDTADWREIFAREFPSGSRFFFIPELLMKKWVRIFGDAIEVEESRDDWDYIWYTKRMSEAKGGALKSYRHSANRFLKRYHCVEERLTPGLFDEIKRFHRAQTGSLLKNSSADEWIDLDSATFRTALDYWDASHLYGTVFRVEGEIAGVLINEIIDENNAVGIYQRQDRKYSGITEYMYISDCRYLMEQGYLLYNVMSDVGSEGLRNAKMRSAPLVMLKKYSIIVK